MAGYYPDWLFSNGPESDLRRRLRLNQIENTPGAAPMDSENLLRARSMGAPQESANALRMPAVLPMPDDETGLKAFGAKPVKYKATPTNDFENVDQFQGRRLGSGSGSISETRLAAPAGMSEGPSGAPLSTPMVGQKGVSGLRSQMSGAPQRGFGENLLRGVGEFFGAINEATTGSQARMAEERANQMRSEREYREDAVRNFDQRLESFRQAGVPEQVLKLAKAAGAYEGSQMLSQYLGTATKQDDELLNVADNEAGTVSAYTKSQASGLIRGNPGRYALAGAASQAKGQGNFINMVNADGSGQPISVMEGSPEHQSAVARRMVEAGPLSLNTRDPIRDRRVAEYQSTYGVDRGLAMKLADGLIRPQTDPVSGQTFFYDLVSQTAVAPQSAGGGAAAPRAPGGGVPRLAASPGMSPPAMSAPALPPPVPGRGVMPGESAPGPAMASQRDPMKTPLLGLVDVFGGKEPLQEAAGKLSMGSYDPGTGVNVPRNRFRIAKQHVFDMYGGADRMSNQDRERIEKAFPGEGVFESPSGAFDSLSTWANEAESVIATQSEVAADTTKPAQLRRDAEAKVMAAQKVLDTVGSPSQFARPGSTPRLKVGDVVKGYRFKGGNPNDPSSWESAR